MDEYTQYLYDTIYEWVKKNFGESEADDPSWSIEALATHLSDYKMPLYHIMEQQFAQEDVADVAEMQGIKLTDDQLDKATWTWLDSDEYGRLNIEAVEWIIREILKEDTTQE